MYGLTLGGFRYLAVALLHHYFGHRPHIRWPENKRHIDSDRALHWAESMGNNTLGA